MTDDDPILVSMVVAVPFRVCSVCGAREAIEVLEAENAEHALKYRGQPRPEGSDLIVRSWREPEGWRTLDLPSGERVQVCSGCGANFGRGVDELIERLKKQRGRG